MNSRRITMLSVSQACRKNHSLNIEDVSIQDLTADGMEMIKSSDLFIVFDQTHYRILKDRNAPFLADRKIPITLLAEEIQDYLKDEIHV